MKVRYPSTGNTGEVMFVTELGAEYVGDLAGTWYQVMWSDSEYTWVPESSVEEIPQ